MTNHVNETPTIETQSILAQYRRAEALEHEAYNQSMVLNAQIFPHWIDGSNCFWYTRKNRKEGGKLNEISTEFRLVNAETATHTEAFDHQLLAQTLAQAAEQDVNPDDLPITELKLALAPTRATFVAFDKHWQFEPSKQSCEAITVEADPILPGWLLSPNRKKAAFSRDYNLWVRDLESGEEHPLTRDGERHYAYALQPEARDLIEGMPGVETFPQRLEALWSPDSKQLFTFQMDERQVRKLPSMLYVPQDGTVAPKVVERKYALPGDKHIAQYRMLTIDVETATEMAADYPAIEDSSVTICPFSGNLAWWSDDSKNAYFVDMTRGQKSARLISFDTQTGSANILFEETAETYLELGLDYEHPSMLMALPDTQELIWYSERTGWAHLYLYDLRTGKLKNAITSGDWRVRDIVRFDKEKREIFIQIAGRIEGRNPYYRELARVNIDSGEITILAAGDCDYSVSRQPGCDGGLSPTSEYVVTTRSRVDEAPATELRDRNGELLVTVETADTDGLPTGWQWPEPVGMKAADGKTDIYGVVFRPSTFDPEKTYPVLDFDAVMPCQSTIPTGAFLMEGCDPFGNAIYMTLSALAELGFIVTVMDGRGTPGRSKAFHDFGYRSFMEGGGMVDHVAGIKQLAERYPYMDMGNVGLISIDGPGNGSVFGLLNHPDFYKVGVAFSIWEPRLVKQGEVFHALTHEPDNQQFVWSDAAQRLQGKLLLVTGLIDQYFHSSMTFQLVDALAKANKDFDLLIQPNGGHGWRVKNAHRRAWDYVVRHLQDREPPRDFELKTAWEKMVPEMMPEKS